jgi:glycosyltransferase involved in cell wall biosynthesis
MTTIRVLHLAPTAFGEAGLFGGGERYPLELARALARRRDVDCELVTFASRAVRREEESGLRVRVLEPLTHLRGHPAHPVAPALLTALGDADVVHAHHMRAAPTRVAALLRKLTRRPIVVTDHGLGGGDWGGMLPRLFDRLLAVSAYSAAQLAVPPARVRLIYGGTDPVHFSPDPSLDRSGVLFVGRLTPHKGVDRLVRALPAGATLTVAGTAGHDPHPPERDYPEHLRALAIDRDVRFVGQVDDAALAQLYRQASVVALPSVHMTCYGRPIATPELLGLTAIEAMASGAAVVASRIGGVSEVIVEGDTGYLVEPGDVAQLRARLEELLADPARARAMGARGRQLVLDRFTWDACAGRCVTAYEEVCR